MRKDRRRALKETERKKKRYLRISLALISITCLLGVLVVLMTFSFNIPWSEHFA